jgi:hypothetical protein
MHDCSNKILGVVAGEETLGLVRVSSVKAEGLWVRKGQGWRPGEKVVGPKGRGFSVEKSRAQFAGRAGFRGPRLG